MSNTPTENRYQATKRVTWVSALTNSSLAVSKIIIGYLGHSHALIADGLHSFSDLISDALVLLAAKWGKRLPDTEHPYGHQRIETLAGLAIALMLLIVAGSLIYDGVRQLIQGHPISPHNGWVILAALLSIGANEWLFRYTLAAGQRWQSNLLITNAYHNRSDVWVSGLVLLAAAGGLIGIPYLDALGAAIIGLLIAKIGGGMVYTGLQELIDAAVDPTTLQALKACIMSVPGVISIHQLRTRLHAGQIFIDVHIIVNPWISVSEGHHIGERVHGQLNLANASIADVTVHIDPENDETSRPSLHLATRQELIATVTPYWQALPGFTRCKTTYLHYLNGEIYWELLIPQSAAMNYTAIELSALYQAAIQHLSFIKQVTIYFN